MPSMIAPLAIPPGYVTQVCHCCGGRFLALRLGPATSRYCALRCAEQDAQEAPRLRVVERERRYESGSGRSGRMPVGKNGAHLQGGGETLDVRRGPVVDTVTLGWQPTCTCPDPTPTAQIILDPFVGSGTSILQALRLGRRAIGIELNPQYVSLARHRIEADCPLLNTQPEVAAEVEDGYEQIGLLWEAGA